MPTSTWRVYCANEHCVVVDEIVKERNPELIDVSGIRKCYTYAGNSDRIGRDDVKENRSTV